MATFNSTQVTNIEASPRVLVPSQEMAGRVRLAYFTYTTPAAGAPAVADVVRLVRLPKNARVIDYLIVWEALSSAAGTAGADFGLSTSGQGARYTTATNMDAAGSLRGTATIDKLPDGTLTADSPTYFQATVTGEAWAVSKKVQGHVLYVVD